MKCGPRGIRPQAARPPVSPRVGRASLRTGMRSRSTIACSWAALLAVASSGCVGGSGHGGAPEPSPRGRPTGASSSLVIGVDGGQVASPDGNLVLVVPPGAVDADVDFTIVEITNTAPGGVGSAYRIGPAGLTLLLPVGLTFQVPASVTGPLSGLSVSTQPGDSTSGGFWIRVPAARDEGARTLTASVDHFSDWALTTSTTSQDLNGPLQVVSTLDQPFTASGWATLSQAGAGASITYYVAGGSLTIGPVAVPGGTCTAAAPIWTLLTNVATLQPGPRFDYGMSGLWDLDCVDSLGASLGSTSVAFALDTVGISHYDCAQDYVGTPTLTASQVTATYRVDCGSAGYIEATWDLVSCTPAASCDANPGACWKGTTDCSTGRPVCLDTTTPRDDGTTCAGVAGGACLSGVCTACSGACATNANPCVAGGLSCAGGVQACLDTATPTNEGLACAAVAGGTCLAGVCTTCSGACSTNPNPCLAGAFSCAGGAPACLDTATPANEGLACPAVPGGACLSGVCTTCSGACSTNANPCVAGGLSCSGGAPACLDTATPASEGLACPAVPGGACLSGVCTACSGDCATNANTCVAGALSCAGGAQACLDTTTPANEGLACPAVSGGACLSGVCTACSGACSTNPEPECSPGLLSCASGSQTCENGTSVADGTACSGGLFCNAGVCGPCVAGGACTTNPDEECAEGIFACDVGGAQICADGTPLPDGTPCSLGMCVGGVCGP